MMTNVVLIHSLIGEYLKFKEALHLFINLVVNEQVMKCSRDLNELYLDFTASYKAENKNKLVAFSLKYVLRSGVVGSTPTNSIAAGINI